MTPGRSVSANATTKKATAKTKRGAERDALGQQRHQHLEGRGARTRNGKAWANGQVHRRDKELTELGVHATGKLTRRTGKRHSDKAHDGQADGGNQKAEHGNRRGSSSLKRQKRRNDQVAGTKEHREQGDADGNDMVGAQTARCG